MAGFDCLHWDITSGIRDAFMGFWEFTWGLVRFWGFHHLDLVHAMSSVYTSPPTQAQTRNPKPHGPTAAIRQPSLLTTRVILFPEIVETLSV